MSKNEHSTPAAATCPTCGSDERDVRESIEVYDRQIEDGGPISADCPDAWHATPTPAAEGATHEHESAAGASRLLLKIQVVRRDGRIETLTLHGPLVVSPRATMLTDASGTDHFFNADGTYDGWGGFCAKGATPEDAQRQIETMEAMRDIKD